MQLAVHNDYKLTHPQSRHSRSNVLRSVPDSIIFTWNNLPSVILQALMSSRGLQTLKTGVHHASPPVFLPAVGYRLTITSLHRPCPVLTCESPGPPPLYLSLPFLYLSLSLSLYFFLYLSLSLSPPLPVSISHYICP